MRDYQFQPRDYVASYRASGLSRRAFGRVANVPESTLREWEKAYTKTARPPKRATVKAAKPPVKANKEVDTYNTVMSQLDTALTSIKTIKRILSTL